MDIDRKRLAAIVFEDPRKLTALNAIVHPVIMRGIADELERLRQSDAIVVLDAALIVEMGLDSVVDAVVVVIADEKRRRSRLVSSRGMSEQDITGRIAAQASPEELMSKADIVVRNNGDLTALAQEADRVWKELSERAAS